jgi:hypothetical protein
MTLTSRASAHRLSHQLYLQYPLRNHLSPSLPSPRMIYLHHSLPLALWPSLRALTPPPAPTTSSRTVSGLTNRADVRKTPSWPRSWANFSLLYLYSHRNPDGPTCIFWANLIPSSLRNRAEADGKLCLRDPELAKRGTGRRGR